MIELSVVIPAFNEANRLESTLHQIVEYLTRREADFEVLVVDDGSRDGTAEMAEDFGSSRVSTIRLSENRGKGGALKAGVSASRGDRVLLTDADLSTPIDQIEVLEPELAEAELVFGSRAASGTRITRRQPFYREAMGKLFNLLLRMSLVPGLRDTQCGFKLLEGDVARRLFDQLTIAGFAYDVELVWLARRQGYRVKEVGVVWDHADESKVHLVLDSARMLRDVFSFPFRHRAGK